jgi:hypothetical protein
MVGRELVLTFQCRQCASQLWDVVKEFDHSGVVSVRFVHQMPFLASVRREACLLVKPDHKSVVSVRKDINLKAYVRVPSCRWVLRLMD